jgi:hypothetical protein
MPVFPTPSSYPSRVTVPSDSELLIYVQAMAAGDVDGLISFQRVTGPLLHAAVVAIVGGPSDASAKTVQSVFVDLWTEAKHYDRHFGRPLMWALAAAREAAISAKGTPAPSDTSISPDHPLARIDAADRDAVLACYRKDLPKPDRGPAALQALFDAADSE